MSKCALPLRAGRPRTQGLVSVLPLQQDLKKVAMLAFQSARRRTSGRRKQGAIKSIAYICFLKRQLLDQTKSPQQINISFLRLTIFEFFIIAGSIKHFEILEFSKREFFTISRLFENQFRLKPNLQLLNVQP